MYYFMTNLWVMLWTLLGTRTLLKNILIFAFTFAVQIYFKRVKNRVFFFWRWWFSKFEKVLRGSGCENLWQSVGVCGAGVCEGVSIFRNWQTEQRWSGWGLLPQHKHNQKWKIHPHWNTDTCTNRPPHVYLVSNEVSLSHTDTHHHTLRTYICRYRLRNRRDQESELKIFQRCLSHFSSFR